jgi:hypothetical protein
MERAEQNAWRGDGICGPLRVCVSNSVRTRGELRYCAESGIRRLRIGKRRKTTRTDRLMAVHLRKIWLVDRAGANVLRMDACCRSKLMFKAKTPLHEVGRVKFSIGHRRDSDGGRQVAGFD